MQIVQSAYFDAGWLQGLVLASCLLVQADSEAFFLPGLLSRSSARPRPLGHAHTRHQRQLLAAAPHRPHHPHPRRPARQVAAVFGAQPPARPQLRPRPRPRHPANTFRAPRLADPGAKMKLDFGGWKPINFDEQLPAKLKRGIKISDLQSVSESAPVTAGGVVTIDTAIAAAPPAQSDDLRHPAPAPAPAQAAVPHIASTLEQSVVYVDSSSDPVLSLLEANNPAVAPPYESSKPVFQSPQYIPRPAVPDKPQYPAPRPALPPQYEPAPAGPSTTPPPPSPSPRYSPAPATEKYPIVALITADSDVPEAEKFVQFSLNPAPAPAPAAPAAPAFQLLQTEQSLAPLARQPKEAEAQEAEAQEADELYYIYYQDPELDPSFGAKIPVERDASHQLGLDIPLYDYDEAAVYREARDQPGSPATAGLSSSSVTFNQNIGGRHSGFSYQLQ